MLARTLAAAAVLALVAAVVFLARAPRDAPRVDVEIVPTTQDAPVPDRVAPPDALEDVATPEERIVDETVAPSADRAATTDWTLAPIDAVLLQGSTERPLADTPLALFDRNGVRVDLKSDARGRVRSDDVLLVGTLRLFLHPDRLDEELEASRGQLGWNASSRFEAIDVDHSGDDAPADVWRVPLARELHIAVLNRATTPANAQVFGRTHGEYDLSPLRTDEKGLTSARIVAIVDPGIPAGAWGDDRIDTRDRDRTLHVVVVEGFDLYVGDTSVSVVHIGRPTMTDVRLGRITSDDIFSFDARFGRDLAQRLKDLLLDLDARRAAAAHEARRVGLAVRGTIVTRSGAPVEGLRVRARPAKTAIPGQPAWKSGVDTVEWDEEGVGHFEISDLDATEYRIEPLASRTPIARPTFVEMTLPAPTRSGADGDVRFTILDDLETIDVAIEARGPDGIWLGGFNATLTARYEGAERRCAAVAPLHGDVNRRPPPTMLARDIPVDAEFDVVVSAAGYRSVTLTKGQFGQDGDRLVATAVLSSRPPARPAPDSKR